MGEVLNFFNNHYQWIFSGIGVFVFGLIFINKKSTPEIKQKQQSGDNSFNIQSGKSVHINTTDGKNDDQS